MLLLADLINSVRQQTETKEAENNKDAGLGNYLGKGQFAGVGDS